MTGKQSATGYVYQHLDVIEKQIEMGFYQEAICREINETGITITLHGFRKAMIRARQKRAGNTSQTNSVKPAPAPQLKVSGKKLSPAELAHLRVAVEVTSSIFPKPL